MLIAIIRTMEAAVTFLMFMMTILHVADIIPLFLLKPKPNAKNLTSSAQLPCAQL